MLSDFWLEHDIIDKKWRFFMKKFMIFLSLIAILIGSIFFYIEIKKDILESDVIEYLIAEKGLNENDIISSEPFISNLRGSKNFMVSVQLKNDDIIYRYYKNKGKIILESYIKDGMEYVE